MLRIATTHAAADTIDGVRRRVIPNSRAVRAEDTRHLWQLDLHFFFLRKKKQLDLNSKKKKQLDLHCLHWSVLILQVQGIWPSGIEKVVMGGFMISLQFWRSNFGWGCLSALDESIRPYPDFPSHQI